MHTLIERPPGQRKYLGENENFIWGVFMKPLLAQTIKTSPSKHHGKCAEGNKADVSCLKGKALVSQRSALKAELHFFFSWSLLVSCCHYYFIFCNGMSKVASGQ